MFGADTGLRPAGGEGGPPRALPLVSDATLRDSAHMAGVEFKAHESATIARLLVRSGVQAVEVGMISGPNSHDAEHILAVHEAIGVDRSMSLLMVRDRRQVVQALDEAERLGVRSVMLSIPTSAEHAALKLASPSLKFLIALVKSTVEACKERGLHVTFSGEDGARAERERLVTYVEAGFAAGADRFRLAETVAWLTPWQMYDKIRPLAAIDGAEIEIHSHNMLGMAVANSLAAYEAGAEWISATVAGVGERGGNAPLAEVLVALRVVYGDRRHDLSALTELTAAVLNTETTGLDEGFMSGPTTPHAFAYELPGQLTHPSAYETIAPGEVGNERGLRVRTRLTPALVEWALLGSGVELDTAVFTKWLVSRQEEAGAPPLDRDAIRRLAAEYRPN
ncbi:MAG: isopropylmalate synthase [Saccharothrix sp.]|nr:isopropylmalate synthase [Saccharothrix sp.]